LATFKNPVTALFLILWFLLVSCSQGNPMAVPDLQNDTLAPCPASPNCVRSDATQARHYIEPLRLKIPAPEAWPLVQRAVAELPGSEIIIHEKNYLRAECRSRIFGFVDDLELQLRPQDHIIAVRSAARWGYADFGVNRKRIETLRAKLRAQGVVAVANE